MKNKSNNIIFSILAIAIIIGLSVWYYVHWEATHYFSTENSKVTAELNTIMAPSAGKLVKLNIEEGSMVTKDQIIGRVENGPYIKSPVNGQVLKCDVVLDQMVAPTTTIAVVAKSGKIYVGANIEETDIVRIQEGQPVSVELDAYPGKKFAAHVEEIEKVTQTGLSGNATSFSTSGTYTKVTQLIPVKIYIDDTVNLDGLIGTNATIKIKVK